MSSSAIGAVVETPLPPAPAVYEEWEPPAVEAPAAGAAYHSDPSNNSRRTDHFIFRWGSESRDGTICEPVAQGHLQMLEHAYDHWRALGLRGLGGKAPAKHYKAVVMPWGSFPWHGSYGAVGFMEGPGVAGLNAPTNALAYLGGGNGCTPHELGHGWQNQGGLPASQPQGWTESLANWYMHLFLVDYPALMPAIGVTPNHASQCYNQYAIFDHFFDRPGYGPAFINRLIFAPNLNAWDKDRRADDIYRKAIRVDTSGNADPVGNFIDELGLMNARMLDVDFWNRDYDRQYARNKDAQREFFFFNRTKLVRQPGVAGEWYRPEWVCVPQAGANSFVPLNITATGRRRTVTCEFRPVSDALNASAYRAAFVAFNRNGEPRYSRVWNAGENTIVLADDEEAVYLTVYGLPKIGAWSIRNNDYTSDAVHLFPFRVRFTGAVPKEFRTAAPATGIHRHANGGGVVADTAEVDASAYVGPEAMVLGSAKVHGKARIEDFALVDGKAQVGRKGQSDDPVVSGYAHVTDEAQVYGHGKVREHAWISGKAQISDQGVATGHTMLKDGKLRDRAVLVQCQLRDRGLALTGDYHGYAIRGGDQSGGGSYDKKVWLEFTDEEDHGRRDKKPDNAEQYLGYTFEKRNAIFAMDQHGMFHSYLMNRPLVVPDEVNGTRTNVLTFDGKSQYVEVRPDALDRRDTTITMWVKWTGAGADQRIFSFGDGAKKVMWLTPKSAGTGKLRFTISDGVRTKHLDGQAPLAANTWAHVAVTFSEGSGSLWLNGKAVARDPALGLTPDQLHAPLMVDANYLGRGNAGEWFAGRLDEFRVFMKPLNEAEIGAAMSRVVAGEPAAADTAAPTPAPAWLVPPAITPGALTGSAIAMSAVAGNDPNGVLYHFRCQEDPTHDSGWLSEPRYIDGRGEAGKTYTFTVTLCDALGNQTTASAPAKITVPAADAQPPQLGGQAFAAAPRGIGTDTIAMTASRASDGDELVMYRFARVGSAVDSGWTSSRTWTDTGLPAGGSFAYTVEAQDGRGNAGKVSAPSPAAIARDDTPPPLEPLHRMQWAAEPFVQLDGTVRMSARSTRIEADAEFRFACVEKPEITSGWTRKPVWISPALPDGTWTFRYQLRDASPQRNESGWSTTSQVRIMPTNRWHDQPLGRLGSLPDSTLVRFTGTVSVVKPDRYVISDGSATIEVLPRSFARRTEPSYLKREVTVEGHLWTYLGQPRQVTYARVVPRRVGGRIECEHGRLLNGAVPQTMPAASYHEVVSLDGEDESFLPAVELDGMPAAKELTLVYAGGEGVVLYVNGKKQREVLLNEVDPKRTGTAVIPIEIPEGATIRIERLSRRWPPRLDCVLLGRTHVVGGTVSGIAQNMKKGAVSVHFSSSPDPLAQPEYVAVVNDQGIFSVRLLAGTWQVAALAQDGARLQASKVQTLTIAGDREGVELKLDWLPGRVGKIEAESGLRVQPASIDPDKSASGGMCVGNLWAGSVAFMNVGPGKRLRIGHGSPGAGTFGLFINGKRQTITFVPTGGYFTFKEMTVAVDIPEHAIVTLQHDDGDGAWNIDYVVIE